MVLWFHGAMVPWFGSPGTFPTTLEINLPAMLFEPSLRHACNDFLLLVRHVTRFGIPIPLFKNTFFSLDSHFVVRAIYLPSLFQPLPR